LPGAGTVPALNGAVAQLKTVKKVRFGSYLDMPYQKTGYALKTTPGPEEELMLFSIFKRI
jgi:hypothetical protein